MGYILVVGEVVEGAGASARIMGWLIYTFLLGTGEGFVW